MSEKIASVTRNLVDVAMGRKPADLVIRNGRWVCVQSGEIIPKTDIAISADPNFRFYFVPDKAGELKADIKDNLGNHYSASQAVTP